MAFDGYDKAGVHRKDSLKSGCISLQDTLILGPDITFVVIKMNILDLACQDFRRAWAGRCRRRWWGRRRTNGDSRFGFCVSTGSGGRHVIRRGRGRVNSTAAVWTDLANPI